MSLSLSRMNTKQGGSYLLRRSTIYLVVRIFRQDNNEYEYLVSINNLLLLLLLVFFILFPVMKLWNRYERSFTNEEPSIRTLLLTTCSIYFVTQQSMNMIFAFIFCVQKSYSVRTRVCTHLMSYVESSDTYAYGARSLVTLRVVSQGRALRNVELSSFVVIGAGLWTTFFAATSSSRLQKTPGSSRRKVLPLLLLLLQLLRSSRSVKLYYVYIYSW